MGLKGWVLFWLRGLREGLTGGQLDLEGRVNCDERPSGMGWGWGRSEGRC